MVSRSNFSIVSHAIGLTAASAVLLVYAVHGSMPHNAFSLPFERNVDTIVVLPEAWAFFTRNPREPRFLIVNRDSGGVWSQAFGVQSVVADGFGLRRSIRALNIEAGRFTADVTDADWERCSGAVTSCLKQSSQVKELTNFEPSPALCGDVALVEQDRVPWAWAKSTDADKMPSRFVHLVVKC
jgi:antimicrobial peptide system SdpA family protein